MSKPSATPKGFGQQPKASPPARTWAVILGIVCLAAAAFFGRETWAITADEGGASWLQPFIDVMASPAVETWMLWGGAAGILVGLVLLWAAFAPRKVMHVQVNSDEASMWLRAVDIARLSSATARRVPGVSAARSKASIRSKAITLNVTVNGDIDDSQLVPRVEQALNSAFGSLTPAPTITVAAEKIPEVDSHV